MMFEGGSTFKHFPDFKPTVIRLRSHYTKRQTPRFLSHQQTVISTETLQQLLREFKQKRGGEFDLQALGYFGSYARGEAKLDSDVDIVFETNRPNLFTTAQLREDLVELLDRPVDVIRYRERMNPDFKARLEKEAIYV